MTVILTLPDHLEEALRARAAAAGQGVDAFVRQVVTDSLARDDSEQSAATRPASDFAQRIESWIALHPVLNHSIDDSRESLYAGREE